MFYRPHKGWLFATKKNWKWILKETYTSNGSPIWITTFQKGKAVTFLGNFGKENMHSKGLNSWKKCFVASAGIGEGWTYIICHLPLAFLQRGCFHAPNPWTMSHKSSNSTVASGLALLRREQRDCSDASNPRPMSQEKSNSTVASRLARLCKGK